jgi:chemotaxis protein methyltransferase CheR
MIGDSCERQTVMSNHDFRLFRELIYEQCGINLTAAKKTMLAARLRKRLRCLGMDSFGQYYDYVSGAKGRTGELVHMLDVVSTNRTEFFREPKHFDYLLEEALPHMVQSGCWKRGRRLNVWSAGCSSGEEPYTIAMVLAQFVSRNGSGDFSILATDISARMLNIARKGIYPESAVEKVPPALKHRYMMRGKGTQKGYCRIVPELRDCLQFRRINLNDGRNFGIRIQMDIVFCRNVIIYFDRQTQKNLFEKFYAQMVPGGYLFIGHSETLHGINDRFKSVSVATYRKPRGNLVELTSSQAVNEKG